MNDAYDAEHGGFGGEPKFPHPWAIRLLLYHYRRDGDAPALERARFTLQRMTAGEMYDRVEGGFFRYATQRDWSAPHFEKIAGDHGPLLLALADLGAATDDAFGPATFGRGGSGSLALGVVLAFVWTPVWAWHRLRVMVFAGK